MIGRPCIWLAAALAAGWLGASPVPAAAQGRQTDGHETRRDEWQRVEDIFKAMQVKPGAVVADIGAGDGFFTTRLATAVGAGGRVHAVDVSPVALCRLKNRVGEAGLTNVEIVQGAVDDPKLPAAAIDAALIVNAYHEMDEHQAMLAKIKAALKPGGRLVIIEPISESRRSESRAAQTRNHEIALEFVRADAKAAGFDEVTVDEKFTSRPSGHGQEWMLVLTPATTAPAQAVAPAAPMTPQQAAAVFSAASDAWKASELRIPMAEFKKMAADQVLVLDVRDPQSFRQGHLPGAVLMTPEELATPAGQAKLRGERRLIVAYCS